MVQGAVKHKVQLILNVDGTVVTESLLFWDHRRRPVSSTGAGLNAQ